ncbi:MAG: hypothetical protein QXL47_01240 [Candidatus Anstonellales archaeon]
MPKWIKLNVQICDGSKATIKVRANENETLGELVKRISGFNVVETNIGRYVKSIDIREITKNKDVIVERIAYGERNGEGEQWIQFYIGDGLPCVVVNNEPVFLSIDNIRAASISEITFKDEEKVDKYKQDFSQYDIQMIKNVSYSCPNAPVSFEISEMVFDRFLVFNDSGVRFYQETTKRKTVLGWEKLITGMDGGQVHCNYSYILNPPSHSFFYTALMKEEMRRITPKLESTKYYKHTPWQGCGTQLENKEQNLPKPAEFMTPPENIKLENPEPNQKNPTFIKPKVLIYPPTQELSRYVLFDYTKSKDIENIKKEEKKETTTKRILEKENKQKIQENYECRIVPAQRDILKKQPPEYLTKKIKISFQNLIERIGKIKNKIGMKAEALKEKIKMIRIRSMIANIDNKIKIIKDRVRETKTKIYFQFVIRVKKHTEQIKANLVKMVGSLTGVLGKKSKDGKKNAKKNKRIIILLLLERWFPKIKKVEKCYL